MKKLYFLIITLISLSVFSQNDHSRYYNSWRLGLNLGGAWQTADYRSCWGMAGGFTLEKGFHENSTNFFSFAIRGRYLAANTYGMDNNRNYGVKNNDAYNGKYDSKVNFVDSVPSGRQFVYDNYKMTLGEGSLELQVTFNRLRERTHILLNLWGGIGITSFRTNSDMLDANGKKYNFSLVDSTGNKTKTLNTYNGLIDKKYESYAYGSKNGNLVTFSPSAGIGLGYQFSPGFSMLWEYKVTFPQGTNADLLDGKLSMNKDAIAGSNDYYHYTGINLLFTLRGKKKTSTANQETVYTNSVAPTSTLAVPTNSIITTNTVVTNTPLPSEQKPIITFITPPVNGMTINTQQYKISAQLLNITNANQIQFKFNGTNYSNFSFNTQTHILEFNSNLISGNNSIQISVSNTAGSDHKLTTIIYDYPKPTGNQPTVNIVSPPVSPANSKMSIYKFKANTAYVFSKNNVTLKINNIITTNFNFNTTTGQIDAPLNLIEGSNSIEIIVSNDFGNDSKNCFINYSIPKQIGNPPIVSLINPTSEINATDNLLYNFKLSVLNVNSKADIEVLFNGVSQSNFLYNNINKEIDFQTNLLEGNNTLSVKGNNQFGFDVKSINVKYTPHNYIKLPPIITFVSPANNLGSLQDINYNFKATIINMPSIKGLKVTFNGMGINNYTYDGINFEYSATLNMGANTLEISAANKDGNDNKTAAVNYRPKTIAKPPVVNIMQPLGTPTVNVIPYDFQFNALNVSQNQIEVYVNGMQITQFNFVNNVGTFNYNLIKGNNTLLIKATNSDGEVTKNESVVLKNMEISTIPTGTTSITTTTITTTTTSTTTSTTSSEKTMVICHFPPGNNQNPQTITIPISAFPAHLAHGDTKGECKVKTDSLLVTPNPIKNISIENNSDEEKKEPLNEQQTITPRKPR